MKTVYEVRVERKVYDDEGNFVASETLFSTESPRPERLLAFAPGQVEAALIDEADSDEAFRAIAALPKIPAVDTFTNERPDGWEAPGDPVPGHVAPGPTEDKPKRTRRTKAQIAEDKAREAAAAAANAAAVDGPPIAAGGMPTPESESAAATLFSGGTLPAEPVPAEGGDGPAATPLTPTPVAPPVEGGAWNPFLAPAK